MQITHGKYKGKWMLIADIPNDAKIDQFQCIATPIEIEKMSHLSVIREIKEKSEKNIINDCEKCPLAKPEPRLIDGEHTWICYSLGWISTHEPCSMIKEYNKMPPKDRNKRFKEMQERARFF